MKELIHIHNQGSELRADSRDVAKLFDVDHKNLRETIESHEDQVRQLGVYRFETAKPIPGSEGGRPEKFAFLNFYQIAFLLTVSKPRRATIEPYTPTIAHMVPRNI
jgi:phage regulator Rha-like protein